MSLDIWLTDVNSTDGSALWGRNITHNVGKIARAVGVYTCIWRPEDSNVTRAGDNIIQLRTAISALILNYDYLSTLNPENGWGNLDQLIDFVIEYHKACMKYPDALIEVSR